MFLFDPIDELSHRHDDQGVIFSHLSVERKTNPLGESDQLHIAPFSKQAHQEWLEPVVA